MKFQQQFQVSENVAKVWAFFEQPARVAACIPGVEKFMPVDSDSFGVVVTQRVGPLAATFDARVQVTERRPLEKICFTSTGKAVRGAIGSFRATNAVMLQPDGDRTQVLVEGDAVLAGVLGSVGQNVIRKQAGKVTAEFARSLQAALSGEGAPAPASLAAAEQPGASAAPLAAVSATLERRPAVAGDPWAKAAALFSGAAVAIGLLILWKCGGHW